MGEWDPEYYVHIVNQVKLVVASGRRFTLLAVNRGPLEWNTHQVTQAPLLYAPKVHSEIIQAIPSNLDEMQGLAIEQLLAELWGQFVLDQGEVGFWTHHPYTGKQKVLVCVGFWGKNRQLV